MDETGHGLFLAADIARAVARAAGARLSSVVGSAIGCLRVGRPEAGATNATGRARHGGVRHSRRRASCTSSRRSARSSPSDKVSRLQDRHDRHRPSAARIEVRAAATRLSLSKAIPSMTIEEAARRRDFTVNAISWDPLTDEYFDPFNGRARSRQQDSQARRSPSDVRRRQSPRAARASVCRALRADAGREHEGAVPIDPPRRSAARTDLGRDRKAAAAGRAARRLDLRSRWSLAWSISCFQS